MLDVLNSCDGCGGQCCRHMVMPPFVPYFEHTMFLKNEEFSSLKRRRPDLVAELKAEYERKQREHDWPEEAPCLWLDQATGRCKHYAERPEICRDFDRGSPECLTFRATRKD